MHITFYNCTADQRRVNKLPYMTQIGPSLMTIDAVNDVDIITPDFTLAYDASYPLTMNYFYIDELKRYYFITTMKEQAGTTLHIKGKEDIRMSKINGNDFTVSVIRNQFIKNSNIIDDSLPVDPQYHEPIVSPWSDEVFASNEFPTVGQPEAYDVIEVQAGIHIT